MKRPTKPHKALRPAPRPTGRMAGKKGGDDGLGPQKDVHVVAAAAYTHPDKGGPAMINGKPVVPAS